MKLVTVILSLYLFFHSFSASSFDFEEKESFWINYIPNQKELQKRFGQEAKVYYGTYYTLLGGYESGIFMPSDSIEKPLKKAMQEVGKVRSVRIESDNSLNPKDLGKHNIFVERVEVYGMYDGATKSRPVCSVDLKKNVECWELSY